MYAVRKSFSLSPIDINKQDNQNPIYLMSRYLEESAPSQLKFIPLSFSVDVISDEKHICNEFAFNANSLESVTRDIFYKDGFYDSKRDKSFI